jgi:hypothetical protein
MCANPMALLTALIFFIFFIFIYICFSHSDRFGLTSMGFVWGLCTLAPATWGLVLGLIAGSVYDAHPSHGQGSGEYCASGAACFRAAFFVNASLCVGAAVAGFVLARRLDRRHDTARGQARRDCAADAGAGPALLVNQV